MTSFPESPRALVVDDDPDFVDLLTVTLKSLGIAVDAYYEVEPFLKHLKTHHPNLCIIDLHIGEADIGFSIVKSIRTVLGDDLPLLIASAQSDPSYIAHAMELGADDYLIKPINLTTLAAKLKNYVTSRKVNENQPSYKTIPLSESSAQIELQVECVAIDELGIILKSSHLLPKGLKIEFFSPELAELLGSEAKVVQVDSTGLDLETGLYRVCCAFNPEDEKFLEDVRKWLAKKTA